MRPLSRPQKPLTIQECAKRIHQHFLVDNNPRCTNSDEMCVYGETGCAIGCLLTEEDAKSLDDSGLGSLVFMGDIIFSSNWNLGPTGCRIFNIYFECNSEMASFLTKVQKVHDDAQVFREEMNAFLKDYLP